MSTSCAPAPQRWPVELYEPTPLVERELVRYQGLAGGHACHPVRRHEARTKLDEIQLPVDLAKRIWAPADAMVSAEDHRWPVCCAGPACPRAGGYTFEATDPRWVYGTRLMVRVDVGVARAEGEIWRLDRLPIGALYRAREDGLPLLLERGADGRLSAIGEHWVIVTPDGLMWLSQTIADRMGARFVLERNIDTGLIQLRLLDGPGPQWAICDGYLVLAEPSR